MWTLKRLGTLPGNFEEFAAEIGAGIARLYGSEAGKRYAETAVAATQATLAHPNAAAWAVSRGKTAAGMLIGVVRERVAEVLLVHVLPAHAGGAIEQQLLCQAVRTFRSQGVEAITAEFVPSCPLDLEDAFAALGFERIERVLMMAALDAPALVPDTEECSVPAGKDDWPDMASAIVAAYEEHSDRRLHPYVQDDVRALRFVRRTARGGFGETRPAFLRIVRAGDECAGVALGCCVAPGVGFLVQLAVRPAFQRQGIGTRLVRELAEAFGAAGLDRMALGVTAASAARRLYERLGFESRKAVDAHVWWRRAAQREMLALAKGPEWISKPRRTYRAAGKE